MNKNNIKSSPFNKCPYCNSDNIQMMTEHCFDCSENYQFVVPLFDNKVISFISKIFFIKSHVTLLKIFMIFIFTLYLFFFMTLNLDLNSDTLYYSGAFLILTTIILYVRFKCFNRTKY